MDPRRSPGVSKATAGNHAIRSPRPEVAASSGGSRLLALNVRSNDITVVDTRTRRALATVAVGNSPHGVAFDESGARAFVTNQHAETISVIDTGALRVVGTVSAAAYPEGIAVHGGQVYVVSWMDDCVVVLDAASGKRLAAIRVGRNPRGFGAFLTVP